MTRAGPPTRERRPGAGHTAVLRPGAALLVLAACAGPAPVATTPSPGCAPLWADSAAAALVELLETATGAGQRVWGDYDLGDGWYVVHAGESAAGGACLGLWTDGRAVAYGEVAEPPRLSTPLYGFYVPEDLPGPTPSRGDQPEAVASWLERAGAGRSAIVPVSIEDFPMELSALTKLQVALHEGFHVQVQWLHWAGQDRLEGGRGQARRGREWPAWDRQPDRPGLQACYRGTEAVADAVAEEREALARTVEALLDDAPPAACRAGRTFLERRAARYAELAGVEVLRADSTPGTCQEAEAIMELEEGAADYASWTQLFDAGLASRERLLGRYRALQDDVFYLTGAMQLHAVALMRPDGMDDVTRRIGVSTSSEEGSITAVFADALDAYCGG